MVSFVLEQGNPSNTDSQFADKVMAYAHFLSQPLNIGQFVPAVFENGSWVVIEQKFYPASMSFSEEADLHFKKYQQAKENVLFEGFEYFESENNGNTVYNKYLDFRLGLWYFNSRTIEDLVKYNLTLTKKFE